MRRGRARSTAEKPEKPRRPELRVMDELCLAPQLCIRCRSYGHVVVSNADPCTCPDDETCSHSKRPLKKKTILVSTVLDRVKSKEGDVQTESDVEDDDDDDDDRASSSSSSDTSSCSTSSSSSSSSGTTSQSEESAHRRRGPTSSS